MDSLQKIIEEIKQARLELAEANDQAEYDAANYRYIKALADQQIVSWKNHPRLVRDYVNDRLFIACGDVISATGEKINTAVIAGVKP